MSGAGSILTSEERGALLKVMNGRRTAALKVRRANALDDRNSVGLVSRLLYLDPDTVRCWLREFRRTGLSSLDPAEIRSVRES